jgi:hypothetical protein
MSEYTAARAADGNGVLFETDEGTRAIKQGGTRAWRNNNPGNIRAGRFANRHGAIGEAGGFAVFPDEMTGRRAVDALLRTETYQELTVGGAIARYAPPNENDTGQYVRKIEEFTGLSASKPMDRLTPEERTRVVDAMQRVEGWQEGRTVPIPARKPQPGSQTLLDRAIDDLDEAPVSAIMGSRPYVEPSHPDHLQAHDKVQAWFKHNFGTEPVHLDATGRMVRPARRIPGVGGGPGGRCVVDVRQHSRGDGKMHVDAHTRSCPTP